MRTRGASSPTGSPSDSLSPFDSSEVADPTGRVFSGARGGAPVLRVVRALGGPFTLAVAFGLFGATFGFVTALTAFGAFTFGPGAVAALWSGSSVAPGPTAGVICLSSPNLSVR